MYINIVKMYSILQNYSLKPFNTFGLDIKTDRYIALQSIKDIEQFTKSDEFQIKPRLVLGGGSNLLFTHDFNGLIIHPVLKGMEMILEDDDYIYAKAYSGENWDTFVECTVVKGYGGLENLSYIPGNVGACPIQNIGAYGVEVQESIVKVEGVNLLSGSYFEMSNSDCQFGYRDSIFKRTLKDQTLITAVTFKLSKFPKINVGYENVTEELKKYPEKNIETVRKAIISIRKNKLPDPKETGNAGSFFKNPIIDITHFEALRNENPEIQGFPATEQQVKISAAWLIDHCGWKGYRKGDAGVHVNQPLVLVNYGSATGKDILDLARQIQQSVKKTFNINLEMEVNFI